MRGRSKLAKYMPLGVINFSSIELSLGHQPASVILDRTDSLRCQAKGLLLGQMRSLARVRVTPMAIIESETSGYSLIG